MAGGGADIGDAERRGLAGLLVGTGAFRQSPPGRPFTLASGATSEHYFDLRLLNGDPAGISAVAAALYRRVRELAPGAASVGGLESGSISIATAVAQLSHSEHAADPAAPLLSAFYVRKAPKAHGTQRAVEGRVASPAVVLDDVVTSGASALAAVRRVRGEGHECGHLMSVMFRGTPEQRRAIEAEGRCALEYVLDEAWFAGWRRAGGGGPPAHT